VRLGRPKQALTDKDIETGVPVGQFAVPKILRLESAGTMDRDTETGVHECSDGNMQRPLAELILSTAVKERMGQEAHVLSQALKGSQS